MQCCIGLAIALVQFKAVDGYQTVVDRENVGNIAVQKCNRGLAGLAMVCIVISIGKTEAMVRVQLERKVRNNAVATCTGLRRVYRHRR